MKFTIRANMLKEYNISISQRMNETQNQSVSMNFETAQNISS